MLSPNAILGQLAKEQLHGLPSLLDWTDTDSPAVAVRLHAFANATDWLLVGETLHYDRDEWGGADAFGRSIWAYGTAAKRHHHVFPSVVADGDVPLFATDTDRVSTIAKTVRIRGRMVRLPAGATSMDGAGLYRALCTQFREQLMSTVDELRDALGMSAVSRLLVLDDWACPADPNRYASSEVLRLIAEVMSEQDPTRYRPQESPNMQR